jgi:hypothetical protein
MTMHYSVENKQVPMATPAPPKAKSIANTTAQSRILGKYRKY